MQSNTDAKRMTHDAWRILNLLTKFRICQNTFYHTIFQFPKQNKAILFILRLLKVKEQIAICSLLPISIKLIFRFFASHKGLHKVHLRLEVLCVFLLQLSFLDLKQEFCQHFLRLIVYGLLLKMTSFYIIFQ